MKAARPIAQVIPPEMSGASVFERLMHFLEENLPLKLNFEDLTGITMDVPDLKLRQPFRIHRCEFCMFAKSDMVGHQECIRNKMAANRVALQRKEPFQGQCHLGVSDMVRPLLYHGQVLGVFYYGSFVAEGTEERARARIRKYCDRRGLDPKPFFKRLEELPRLKAAQMSAAWRHLDLAAELIVRVLAGFGQIDKRYRTRSGAQFMAWNKAMPAVVGCAIRHINLNYGNPLRVSEIAKAQRCHPDYLSRIFKQTIGMGIGEYINRLRVDHARRLLSADRFSLGEIGFMVGFYDQSHFAKVFRESVGMTPKEYRQEALRKVRVKRSPLEIAYFDYSNLHEFNPKLSSRRRTEAHPRQRAPRFSN